MAGETFMREAIRLAREGMETGQGGPFGCVVVRRGEIVGRGCNRVLATNDPTAHAEMLAIREACRELGTFRLEDCELYASGEPCPMCLGAIYWARLPRVRFANSRLDAAAIGFDDEFIYGQLGLPPERRRVAMESMLREEALELFREWGAKTDKVAY